MDRNAYMKNLKLQTAVNNQNYVANKLQPAAQQYMNNTGQSILGLSHPALQSQPDGANYQWKNTLSKK
jgi:hypothetical protein